MHRRQVLRLGAATLPLSCAGCASDGGDGGAAESPTTTPTASPSPSPSPTPSGTPVELVARADQPDASVEYDATMAESLATGEGPARVRVTIRNPTDSAVVLGEERAVQFHHVTSENGSLYLLPAGTRAEEFAEPGCWRLTDRVAVPEYYGTIAVPAGEAIRAESSVLGSADLPEGTCLPPGEHRVGTSGRAAPSADGVIEGADDATDFEWRFTLRVG